MYSTFVVPSVDPFGRFSIKSSCWLTNKCHASGSVLYCPSSPLGLDVFAYVRKRDPFDVNVGLLVRLRPMNENKVQDYDHNKYNSVRVNVYIVQ